MRGRIGGLTASILLAGVLANIAAGPAAAKTLSGASSALGACDGGAIAQTRSTLYFGLSKPASAVNKAMISQGEWEAFLKDEVTPRFPAGLTVLDGRGQWREASGVIAREPSKVLILDHPDTAAARKAIGEIIAAYRKRFEQEAVMWERSPVCVAF